MIGEVLAMWIAARVGGKLWVNVEAALSAGLKLRREIIGALCAMSLETDLGAAIMID